VTAEWREPSPDRSNMYLHLQMIYYSFGLAELEYRWDVRAIILSDHPDIVATPIRDLSLLQSPGSALGRSSKFQRLFACVSL
jgi:hypothetical protein